MPRQLVGMRAGLDGRPPCPSVPWTSPFLVDEKQATSCQVAVGECGGACGLRAGAVDGSRTGLRRIS